MFPIRRLAVYLIKPSKYDEDGYVIRYWRGVLPSNTLTCLYGLTEDVRERGVLGRKLDWQIELIDESVQRVDVCRILREGARPQTKAVVCLVGVQSNQFARATDLALAFRAEGLTVLLGGFHVSGSLAMQPEMPEDLRRLVEAGVSVVAGEIEGRWEGILRDALAGRLQPVYNFLLEPPVLREAPMPRVHPGYLQRFVATNFTTMDCGRGCPFNCSFCTVINVQGRTMRLRDVERLLATIRDNYYRHRIGAYFFTDDNFCRNRYWEAMFDGLIRLRQQEGIRIAFMVQVDTQSYRLPRFIDKAKAAGCSQVFIGLESLNPHNLAAAGKRQNRIDTFQALFEAYRAAGINAHVAYIIGFPFDTPASVAEDIRRLREELGPEQASFFMLTPLPGSQDHVTLTQQGAVLDRDFNQYDSFHATMEHPRMSREEWTRAYDDAWKQFYSVKNMRAILRRATPENYWAVFANFIWYKNAVEVEGGHPMIHGFVRLKSRGERRPGAPVETRWRFAARRARDLWRYVRLWPRLALEMEEVWLQTRSRSALEQRVIEELRRIPASAIGWRRMRVIHLRRAYQRAACALRRASPGVSRLPRPPVPPHLVLWVRRWNPFSQSLTSSRRSMRRFWRRCLIQVKRGNLHALDVSGLLFNSLQETALFATFACHFFSRLLVRLFARSMARA
ncbi:MAG: radical SAM protein [Candidatus Omnitrophica bacterium]|nr:radical SAM protein [Candidatus Omnitrophota bacterium]